MPTTWDEIIERAKDGRFGDLQISTQNGSVKRGPITTIRRDEKNLIVLEVIWMAFRESIHDDWERLGTTAVKISDQCRPYFNLDGFLCFGDRYIGEFKVFPKQGGMLEPDQVYDLEPDEVRRHRAWMYGLPLESDWDTIVERVVDDLGADGLATAEEQLQVQEERDRFAKAA